MALDESTQKLVVNGSLADSLFVIDPPEGAMIIDLDKGIGYKKGEEDKIYLLENWPPKKDR